MKVNEKVLEYFSNEILIEAENIKQDFYNIQVENQKISGYINGSSNNHYVEVVLTENGFVENWTCNCYYAKDRRCKHICALILLAMEDTTVTKKRNERQMDKTRIFYKFRG